MAKQLLTKPAFDPLEPGYFRDPYPLFSYLIKTEPIYESPEGP